MTKINKILNAWDRMMMAVTFAEADEAESARELLGSEKVRLQADARQHRETAGENDCALNPCPDLG